MRLSNLFVAACAALAVTSYSWAEDTSELIEDTTAVHILVTSVPSGAQVFVDGKDRGTTPVGCDGLSAGNHTLRLTLINHKTIERTIPLAAGARKRISVKLQRLGSGAPSVQTPLAQSAGGDSASTPVTAPQPVAPTSNAVQVSVATEPPGAHLFVDGDSSGITPMRLDSLAPGAHTFVLKLDGYKLFSRMLTFNPGSRKKISIRLSQILPRLVVTSTPDSATVTLGDSVIGRTPYSDTSTVPGTYPLKVSLDKYVSVTQTVTVTTTETCNRSFVLMTQVAADSIKVAQKRKNRNARRVVFGLCSLVFGGIGLAANAGVADAVDDEKKAFAAYSADAQTQTYYDATWAEYKDAIAVTDGKKRARNALYGISGLFAVGFAISIPF